MFIWDSITTVLREDINMNVWYCIPHNISNSFIHYDALTLPHYYHNSSPLTLLCFCKYY